MLLLLSMAFAAPLSDPLRETFKHDPPPPMPAPAAQLGWDIQHYDIDVDLDTSAHRVDGVITITARARADAPGPLLLHAEGPLVAAITQDGAELAWTQVGSELSLAVEGTVAAGEDVVIVVTYSAPGNLDEGPGLNWGEPVYSFHEPVGARKWLVVYDDPADKATLAWHVRVSDGRVVVANGVLGEVTDEGDGTSTWNFTFDEPIATYLMVVHAGDYVGSVDETGMVPVWTWASPALHDAAVAQFANTPDMITYFSALWVDYPWTHYANVLAPFGGAMEHTTATTFGDHIVEGGYAEFVNAHELAHHWWGDLVTCADWDEIWLNEGFASYGEVLWAELAYDEETARVYRGWQRDSYLEWRFIEGEGTLYDPNYMWGGTVYDKGSFVLHMLRTVMGDEAFFDGLRLYVDAHAHDVVTTTDLSDAMSEAAGQDMGWFFDAWIYQAGDPAYSVSYAERQLDDGSWQIDLHIQETTEGTWPTPVAWTLELEDGQVVDGSAWVEDDEVVVSACTDRALSALNWDPDVDLLYSELTVARRSHASAALVCGADSGLGAYAGSGCASGGGLASVGGLAIVSLAALRRRRVQNPPEGRSHARHT